MIAVQPEVAEMRRLFDPTDPLMHRVRELRVDRLLSKLYFTEHLKFYDVWSRRDAQYAYALIESSESIEGGLALRLCGTRYEIRTDRRSAYDDTLPRLATVTLTLTADGTVVFAATYIELAGDHDDLFISRVHHFAEGPWISHFRALFGEVSETRRVRYGNGYQLSDDEFYRCEAFLADASDDARCGGCPLVASLRTIEFSEAPPAQLSMCDYHWLKFHIMLQASPDGASDANEHLSYVLGVAPSPRRCEWSGCGARVEQYIEVPSTSAGIDLRFFFCETHRSAWLRWFNDRSQPVALRLLPTLVRAFRLWLATRRRAQRIALILSVFFSIPVLLGAVLLSFTVPTWWVPPAGAIAACAVVGAALYFAATAATWAWSGFTKV